MMPTTTTIEWTGQQREAMDAIGAYLDAPTRPYFSLGGLAGTGKTAVLAELLRQRPHAAVCAFTGKAVSVLRGRGLYGAQTLHSLIYRPEKDPRGKTIFVRRDHIDFREVFVDEASMLNRSLRDDVLSYGAPVVFVGDPGQLEPIGEDVFLMRSPDYTLTEIHRQAKGSAIIGYSAALRRGQLIYPAKPPELVFGEKVDIADYLDDHEQVLCGYNKTRVSINAEWRRRRKYKGLLAEGDKIICLRNNARLGVFNGLTAVVQKVTKVGTFVEFVAVDDLGVSRSYLAYAQVFGSEKLVYDDIPPGLPDDVTFWDYAAAITVHKSQGSQWKSVCVLDESNRNWDMKRWRYTAVTRAQERLTYCR